MDDTEETEFCGCLDNGNPPLVVQVVWAIWDFLAMLTSWLNIVALLRAFRDVAGSEPITFYEWPEGATVLTTRTSAPRLPDAVPPPRSHVPRKLSHATPYSVLASRHTKSLSVARRRRNGRGAEERSQ
jgi:hypothetical protein